MPPMADTRPAKRQKTDFVCDRCERPFAAQRSLDQHRKTASYCLDPVDQGTTHACARCGKVYRREDTLNRHEREVHQKIPRAERVTRPQSTSLDPQLHYAGHEGEPCQTLTVDGPGVPGSVSTAPTIDSQDQFDNTRGALNDRDFWSSNVHSTGHSILNIDIIQPSWGTECGADGTNGKLSPTLAEVFDSAVDLRSLLSVTKAGDSTTAQTTTCHSSNQIDVPSVGSVAVQLESGDNLASHPDAQGMPVGTAHSSIDPIYHALMSLPCRKAFAVAQGGNGEEVHASAVVLERFNQWSATLQ